jgi:Icc-related predicted phosphoesterase
MMLRRSLLLLSLTAGGGLAGCKQKPAEIPVRPEATSAAVVQPQGEAAQEQAQRAEPECAAAPTAGEAQEVQVAGRKAVRAGTTLSFQEKDADGTLVLGVLGPLNEDSGENMLTLKKYVKFFNDEKVDAVVVTGDVGEVPEGISRVLTSVAQVGKPVMVIAGNRECREDYVEGVKAAQSQNQAIVDMNQVRMVEFPEGTLVSLPGHHDPNFINCETGCRYYPSTVDETIQLARSAKSPVVLVAHGPPRGEGTQALDYQASNANVGATDINRALEEGKVPFGVFSNIKEAGARATDLAGTTIIPQERTVPSLYLNPGPADTMGWKMNDGTTSNGFAAVLRLKDGGGSWKLFRAPALSAAEKKQAQALRPTGAGTAKDGAK